MANTITILNPTPEMYAGTRTFEDYTDMQVAHQNDVNRFPCFWLFGRPSPEKEAEALASVGASSLDECMGIVGGGAIRKVDKPAWDAMFERMDRETKAFDESRFENLVSRIETEMNNHEYGYTRDPDDTLRALGKWYDDLENDERFNKAWCEAHDKVTTWYDEHCA